MQDPAELQGPVTPNPTGFGRNGQELAHLRHLHGLLRKDFDAFKQHVAYHLDEIHRRLNSLEPPEQTHVNQLLKEAQERVDEVRQMVSGTPPTKTIPQHNQENSNV